MSSVINYHSHLVLSLRVVHACGARVFVAVMTYQCQLLTFLPSSLFVTIHLGSPSPTFAISNNNLAATNAECVQRCGAEKCFSREIYAKFTPNCCKFSLADESNEQGV